jgi:glycosyltransferase involved in cell wall biosynthesis
MNVEQLVQDGVSGIATYTTELVRRLPAAGWEVTPFTARHARTHVDAAMRAAGLPDVHPVVLPMPRPALYDAWHTVGGASPLRRIAPVDLVHAPSVAVPPISQVPLVVTAHDAAPVTFPDTYTRRGRWFHERGFAAAAKRARLVIAVSEFSASELVAHTPIRAEQIRVVPNGVDLTRADGGEVARVRAVYGIGDAPYVFWVGTRQPRKNVAVLVDAFVRGVAPHVPHSLVLGGPSGWLDDGAADSGGARVLAIGSVARDDLAGLYAGADLFAFPSLHEGFGLPVLEAMAQGTAVLAGDIAVLHEVASEAAHFVSPTDVDGWSDALRELLTDVAARDALAAGGPARAAMFSWEQCVTRTAAVYDEAL